MKSIVIDSDGTPFGTKLLTHDGHEIHGCYSLDIHVDVDGPARATAKFLMPCFKIEINKAVLDRNMKHLFMREHNRAEYERLGISRIH